MFPANLLCINIGYKLIILWQQKNILIIKVWQKWAALKNLTYFGLSYSLKEAFPEFNISLIDTMSYNFRGIPLGMWVAGFASGDESFYTNLTQYKDTIYTGCVFKITLHLKDTALLEGLYDYLSKYFPNISFNKYNSRTNKGIFVSKHVSLNISNIKDIGNIVIPFYISSLRSKENGL